MNESDRQEPRTERCPECGKFKPTGELTCGDVECDIAWTMAGCESVQA